MKLKTGCMSLVVFIVLWITTNPIYAQTPSQLEMMGQISQYKSYLVENSNDKKLHFALAQSYLDLANNFNEGRQPERAQGYLDTAQYHFKRTLELDPNYFEGLYGYGAMYYNIAMEYYGDRQSLPLSAKEEYKQITDQTNSLLQSAHNLFVKAEIQNPNDEYLIIALKELYTITGQAEAYVEYKNRLKTIQSDPSVQLKPYDAHTSSSDVKL